MIKQYLNVAGYWNVIIYYKPKAKYYKDITKTLKHYGVPDSIIDDIHEYVFDIYNTGFTMTSSKKKLSIVCISKTTSNEEFIDTIVHEAKHIQSHICEYYNVPEDGEDAAYLIGFLVKEMYKVFKLIM